ncbi:MAG: ferrous iron transport protein A [Bacteroidetes bacterium]|nr:ferrous iron transport protein A [Bacteroidota bacterium]MBL0096590.1 ferrous iron transport protein A [Bacteroidota bacterium]
MRLSSLHKGESAIIDSFMDDTMKQKLLEMGFLPGDTVTLDRFAPLGCPIAIEVNGSTLGIRLDEAAYIIVKPIH